MPPPTILVFDSGLGGLTVFDALAALYPPAHWIYAADDAAFPYGDWHEPALTDHIVTVVAGLIEAHKPELVVVACNTASTLVLPPLRARWPQLPFVGTVPAVKPAAAASRSKLISVLGTPGTVAREYTLGLVAAHAADCDVTLVGAPGLAALAEAAMRGEAVDDAAVATQIAPCFVVREDGRTDAIALACTHYPLLTPWLERLAPWPVAWIDPAPAIARQAIRVLERQRGKALPTDGSVTNGKFVVTSGRQPEPALGEQLRRRGLIYAAASQSIVA